MGPDDHTYLETYNDRNIFMSVVEVLNRLSISFKVTVKVKPYNIH